MTESDEPIEITYRQDGVNVELTCDLLVAACDPRPLLGLAGLPQPPLVMRPTPDEKRIFGALTDFVFQTTLLTVDVPPDDVDQPIYGAILDPARVSEMRGDVSGFRNESAKQYTLEAANGLTQNHVVVYQLWGPESGTPRPSQAELSEKLDAQLADLPWWPYKRYQRQSAALHTSYFNHFDADGLQQKLPWQYLGIQGQHRTLYLHASTCFESVLQCWQYQNLLLSPQNPYRVTLPADKDAAIVILGAGVSGLLFADRLRRQHGYTNITLLEQSQRIGGKTDSVVLNGPRPSGSKEDTVCELGTCYLSPAYDELFDHLEPFWETNASYKKNERRGFVASTADSREFRGMVTTGTIPKSDWSERLVPYTDYVMLRYEQLTKWPKLTLDELARVEVETDLAILAAEYIVRAELAIGSQLPMPAQPPAQLSELVKSYEQWLVDHELTGLIGILEYAYSIQGYGPLRTIPAYYGLVWISVVLAERLVVDSWFDESMVTFWSRGWGEIWERMAAPMMDDIRLGAAVLSIRRDLKADD